MSPPNEAVAEYYPIAGSNEFHSIAEAYQRLFAGKGYERILLLDDDIRFRAGKISTFFDVVERERLDLSQPARTWGTNVNHVVTSQNAACAVRRAKGLIRGSHGTLFFGTDA